MDNLVIKKNKKGRDYIIGDLHGCYDDLLNSMESVNFDKETDRLFSVGDLIDRGPNSFKCLSLIYEDWFFAVRGNHEDMMIDSLLNGRNTNLWLINGGEWLSSIKLDTLKNVARDFECLVPYSITLETNYGNIGICHSEPPTNDWKDVEKLTESRKYSMLWDRYLIREDDPGPTKNIDLTIHGHTPVRKIYKKGNYMFIDTGVVYGNNLTILRLDNILKDC